MRMRFGAVRVRKNQDVKEESNTKMNGRFPNSRSW